MSTSPVGNGKENSSSNGPAGEVQDRFHHLYSREALVDQPTAIRDMCALVSRPEVRSLAGGWPDPDVFPIEDTTRLFTELMGLQGVQMLQYGSTEGLLELRQVLAERMVQEGMAGTGPENIFLTHGSAQGMQLAAQVFINRDEVFMVGLPTYFGGPGSIKAKGGRCAGVPVDHDGMDTEALARELKRLTDDGEKVKGVYVVPNFQNPMGTTLSLPRRKQLMDLAHEYDLIVIEDDPYRDLIFEGEHLPSLKSFDQDGRVLHLRSISKTYAPGLRLGWIVADPDIVAKIGLAKQYVDTVTNSPAQHLFLEYIKRGHLDRRIALNIEHYRAKRNFMLGCLERYFPKGVSWSHPRGGFFLFVTLPPDQDAIQLLSRAADNNVAFVPGQPFFVDKSGTNTFRLSYSQACQEDMEEAIKILGELLSQK